MNIWLLASIVLVATLIPLVGWASRRGFRDALIAVVMASLVTVLALVTMTEAFNRPPLIDLALVLAFISFASALACARYIEGGLG